LIWNKFRPFFGSKGEKLGFNEIFEDLGGQWIFAALEKPKIRFQDQTKSYHFGTMNYILIDID